MQHTQQTITYIIDKYVEKTADKTFLIDANLDLFISYRQLKKDIKLLGSFFYKHDIKLGDKVGFLLDNSYKSTLLFLSAIYHGITIVPINVVAGSKQILYVIKHSQCKILFTSKFYANKFKNILDSVHINIFTNEQITDLNHKHSNLTYAQKQQIKPDTAAILIYTSGTTGIPKGVMLSHKNMLAGGMNTALAHKITTNDIGLCVLPLYHINAEMVSISSTLVSNSCVVIIDKFSISNFWQTLEKYKCTWFSVVPTIINYLLNDNFNISKLKLNNIRFGRSASAPLSPEVHKKFEQIFKINIIETMGLTETSAQILSNPLTTIKHGSAGIAYGNEVKIINDKGAFVKPGELGELVVKGDNVMQTYYKNTKATNSAFTKDKYFLTGDLGFEDEDGFFFITGRKKELIIKGGENISPREIDDTLYKHNAVLEACSFGVFDKDYGEQILACVFLKDNYKVSEDELKQLCTSDLGLYKTPSKIIFVNKSLPKGPSGKIQRLKIANNYKEKTIQ